MRQYRTYTTAKTSGYRVLHALSLLILSWVLFAIPFHTGMASSLAWFSLTPMALLWQRQNDMRALQCGWLFGLGIWLSSVWWLSDAAISMGGATRLVAYTLVLIYCSYAALPYALIGFLYSRYQLWKTGWGIIAMACGGTAILILYPLPIPGYVIHGFQNDLLTLQWLSIGGMPLLLVLAILISLLIANSQRSHYQAYLGLSIMFLVYAGGYVLLHLSQKPAEDVLRIAAIQPNTQPERRSLASHRAVRVAAEQTLKFVQRQDVQADLIVWPELPVAMSYSDRPMDRQLFDNVIQRTNLPWLINGYHNNDNTTQTYRNRIWSLQTDNEPNVYDKQRLVPFGEYLPDAAPWLAKFLPNIKHYTHGLDHNNLRVEGWEIATPICYEAIFPDIINEQVASGANLIINPGNDFWFQSHQAAKIHLALARFRAIEQRRAMLRVFNSGITALILPSGQLHPAMSIRNVQYEQLYPVPVHTNLSTYNRIAGWITALCAFVGVAAGYRHKKRRLSNPK